MIGYWGGHFETWALGEKVSFDTVNRLIYVNDGVTELDIKRDVYSGWKRWSVAHPDHTSVPAALRATGGDPTVGGQFSGDIYFAINNWRLVVDFSQTTITGILFSDDFATAYLRDDLTAQSPAIVSSTVNAINTGSGVSTQDIADIADAVWDESAAEHTEPGSLSQVLQDITPADLAALETTVTLIRKLMTNRVQISPDNAVTTIFDDDKVTPIQVFDHADERNRDPR